MKSLESMENLTSEFQRLTKAQQQERRRLLSKRLGELINNYESLGLTKEEAVRHAFFNELVFHLGGNVDSDTYLPKKRKK